MGATATDLLGFAMMFLAALHGRENWQAMKQGAMTENPRQFRLGQWQRH